jgi:hypothetical protein
MYYDVSFLAHISAYRHRHLLILLVIPFFDKGMGWLAIIYFVIWAVISSRLYAMSNHNEFVFVVALLWPIFVLIILMAVVMYVHEACSNYFNKL